MVPERRRHYRRPAPSPGAGLLLLGLLLGSGWGCGGSAPDTPDPEIEAGRELGLRSGARLHRVLLGGRGSEEHLLPARTQARVGDAVEFVTVDHRVHTLAFPRDSLTEEARRFLAGTVQLAIPPLLTRGSRFLLILESAPEGTYPFVVQGHGGTAHGVVEVGTSPDSLAPGRP